MSIYVCMKQIITIFIFTERVIYTVYVFFDPQLHCYRRYTYTGTDRSRLYYNYKIKMQNIGLGYTKS
jgi:hypothetical protein